MGWDSSSGWQTKKDVQLEVERSMIRSGWTIHDVKSTSQGIYWLVTIKDQSKKSIYCAMVERHNNSLYLKTMSEDAGPFMSDCPVRIINGADKTDNEHANKFRQNCINAAMKKTLDLTGKAIVLYGNTYLVLRKEKQGYIVRDLLMRRYKMSRKQITECEVLT